jgi:hypothetical protein
LLQRQTACLPPRINRRIVFTPLCRLDTLPMSVTLLTSHDITTSNAHHQSSAC